MTAPGLREAKKTQARDAIRREALRLFGRQGFAATTVEQIAAAANVSPRTLFRYFPSKDAIVLAESESQRLADAVRRQPPQLSRIEAIRRAVHELFGTESPELGRDRVQRDRLVEETPELAAIALTHVRRNVEALTVALEERSPRAGSGNRGLAGSVVGLMLAVDRPGEPTDDAYVRRVDEGLDLLAGGFTD